MLDLLSVVELAVNSQEGEFEGLEISGKGGGEKHVLSSPVICLQFHLNS